MNRKECFRYFGRSLRIAIFCLNAIGWTVGMLCLLGAILVGFYSKTIKIGWAFDLYDFSLTTPCTIMFYYGAALGIATASGCFAGSGGRWWCTGLYCLLLIALAVSDFFWGIQVFYKRSSLMDFLDTITESMQRYGQKDAQPFGIYPHKVEDYWDHIQQQSHCCGMYHWSDWSQTPIGKHKDLPDSCCNERYSFATCGQHLMHHPDNVDHQIMDVIHTKGCMQAYPKRFIWAFYEASLFGICLAVVLLLCFLLSLILFIIVVTCCYRPGHPITDPTSNSIKREIDDQHQHDRRHSYDKRLSSGYGHKIYPIGQMTQKVAIDEFGRRRSPAPLSLPQSAFIKETREFEYEKVDPKTIFRS